MAWKKEEAKVIDPATLVNREHNWESNYPSSLERWAKDLAEVGYVLDAEYDLGDSKTLYRFKSDKGLFQNVIIESTAKKEAL